MIKITMGQEVERIGLSYRKNMGYRLTEVEKGRLEYLSWIRDQELQRLRDSIALELLEEEKSS